MSQSQIRMILFLIGAILISVLVYATFHSISSDLKFWDSFWPSFWSDLVVGIVVAAIISWALRKSKRIDAGVVANANELGADVIANEIRTDGATHIIRFAIRNTCDHFFGGEGIYWHLFVEKDCFVDAKAATSSVINYQADTKIGDGAFHHLTGLLSTPVFPKRYVEIVHVAVTAPRNRETELRYFLSTANGLFPKKMRYDKRGDPDLNYVAKVVTIN